MVFNIVSFAQIISSINNLLEYLRANNLLRKEYICCNQPCGLVKDSSLSDGEIFKCRLCKKRYSIRTGSFFGKSKLKLHVLFTLLFCFIRKISVAQTLCLLDGEIGEKSVIQWFAYYREICSLYLHQQPPLNFGNNVSVVEMDEAYIGHKRKYHRGAFRGHQYCLFGIIDSETKKCIVEIVPNRQRDTLLPIIRRYVPLGSVINTDSARAYHCLNEVGYQHSMCNHSQGEYVAPDGTHTNTIENLWSHLKSTFKQMRGTRESMIPLHVDEFMYRWNRKFDGDIYDLFIQDIALFYPLP